MVPPLLTAAVPSIISGVAGLFGARSQNRTNQREAQKNRDFQERMRNTQWQSAVHDMEAAGINPALAYSQGGNAAPGGSLAAPATDTMSSAMGMIQAKKGLQLLDQQVRKATAEAKTASAEANFAKQRETYMLGTFDVNGHRSSPRFNDVLDAEVRSALSGADNLAASVQKTNLQNQMMGPMAEFVGNMGQVLPWLGLIGSGLNAGGNLIGNVAKWRGAKSKIRTIFLPERLKR